ncbi:unnamed protein product [Spirodela intermedia]|uniref:EF-hand domain-containing protein n=1 Tax=Spirodela intermedia TaxID=51605 RepID=A0A7I8JXX8_SPIIN|nr:unnamed protein product [Spirodela intermedia]
MKLIASLFSSSASSCPSSPKGSGGGKKSKTKRGSKERSASRNDASSTGSSRSSGASGSDSFSKATARTPRTVIIGRNASCLDAEYWSPSPADLASKAVAILPPAAGPKPSPAVPPAVSELFCVFDRDGDGKITKEELELVLGRLGKSDPPTEEELSMMMAEVDRDGDGCISLEEFGVLAPVLPSSGWGAAASLGHDDLREAFGIFDADGDGNISAEELLGVFLTLGDDRCTLDDCRGMIRGVDSRGDGYVCFDDFVRMMGGQR